MMYVALRLITSKMLTFFQVQIISEVPWTINDVRCFTTYNFKRPDVFKGAGLLLSSNRGIEILYVQPL